jgi:hypothetical protein
MALLRDSSVQVRAITVAIAVPLTSHQLHQTGSAPLHRFSGSGLYAQPSACNELSARFAVLAERWKMETGHLSNFSHRAEHPAYQEIIAIGAPVVPFLLKELKTRPAGWFWALHEITGADPVPEHCRGRLDKMADAWLAWGKSFGYDV